MGRLNTPELSSSSQPSIDRDFKLAEYKALREEILKRIEFQYQLVSLTLIIAGTMLALGLDPGSPHHILLVFPVIAVCLAGIWAHNIQAPRRISAYIQETIESRFNVGGWEGTIAKERYTVSWSKGILSSGVIFLFTELVAVILGLLKIGDLESVLRDGVLAVLVVCDVVSIVLTLFLIWPTLRRKKLKDSSGKVF